MKESKAFNSIECRGTPYEIGHQYGVAGKENILKSMEMCFGVLNLIHKATKEDVVANAMKYYPIVKEFDPYLIDIIKGQADGVGVSFEEVFALRSIFDVFMYYAQVSSLCTSFAVTGAATKDGKTILGQNIDWFTGTPIDLLKIHHSNGLRQLVLSIWGVEVGLSSAGFGICANGTWASVEDFSLKIPFGCYLPKVMRQRDLDDAFGLLREVARGLEYYHLGNAEGKIIGIESVQNDFNIMQPERDTLVHSNNYLTDRFKKGDMSLTMCPDSFQRVDRIQELIKGQYGNITPGIMMEILADHENFPNSLCRHADEKLPPQYLSETLASFIMVPEDGTMYVASGNPCAHDYVEYKL